MTSVKQDIPKINPSNDVEEDKSISSNSTEMKEAEYSSSSSSSVSLEDKKVIGENTINTNAVKNVPQETQGQLPELEQDKAEKKEKRTKRDSFRRMKKEGEVLVKSLTGMFGKEKSINKKQELDNSVPQSPRRRYNKSSSSSSSETRQKRHSFFSSYNNNNDQQKTKTRDYPLSDDDDLKTNRKTRNRLSINFSDKKEKENRRKTFHFTKDFSNNNFINDYENNTDNVNDNSSSSLNPISVKTNFKSILPTTEYDSPISGNLTINSAPVSPINEKTIQSTQNFVINEDEQQIEVDIPEIKEQKNNETTVITISLNEEEKHIEQDNNDVVEQNLRRISNISNDTEISDDIRFDQIYNTTNDDNNSYVNNTQTFDSEEPKIIYKAPEFKFPTHNNEVGINEANHHNKIEKTLEENSKINTLESIVLRQLDLAEKMQETMSRLESKVSGQMEDTIRKLENKINDQNNELDDLKTIVGKLQKNQQMMIANEAYNQDLQTIRQELALISQSSSTSFSLAQNLQQQHHQVYMKDTLVDTLVVKPLCKTITVSASVMYAVYIQPVISLARVVKQRL